MTWEVRISREVVRYLSRMEEKRSQILREILKGFRENPFVGDVKPIKVRPSMYRRRVGACRII